VAISRKLAALLTAGALCLPVAACGEDDVDQARKDVQDKADELNADLDDLSKQDLQKKLDDVEDAAKNGSEDTKQKARELENKIEREIDSRK
jgi:Skp family chaperone for outer membrane proteins